MESERMRSESERPRSGKDVRPSPLRSRSSSESPSASNRSVSPPRSGIAPRVSASWPFGNRIAGARAGPVSGAPGWRRPYNQRKRKIESSPTESGMAIRTESGMATRTESGMTTRIESGRARTESGATARSESADSPVGVCASTLAAANRRAAKQSGPISRCDGRRSEKLCGRRIRAEAIRPLRPLSIRAPKRNRRCCRPRNCSPWPPDSRNDEGAPPRPGVPGLRGGATYRSRWPPAIPLPLPGPGPGCTAPRAGPNDPPLPAPPLRGTQRWPRGTVADP